MAYTGDGMKTIIPQQTETRHTDVRGKVISREFTSAHVIYDAGRRRKSLRKW
jgi:hypothetical protein